MIRVIGFALFFIAVGIVIMMFLPSKIAGACVALACIIVGYNMFCFKKCKK
ncbi:MAG: hypothetical protein ACI39H_05725 [Lachnospiraceae bacterium]